MFLPAKSALDHQADIDMKAFPPISVSGWNNKLILAVLLKTTAVVHSGVDQLNDSLIWKEEKFFIKFEEFKNCKQDIVNW